MSISGIGSGTSVAYQNSIQSQFQQRRADIQQLGQSLGVGNLAGAQQAFSALMSLFQTQSNSAAMAGGNGLPMAGGNGSPLSAELAQIGQALQSGNLSGAQQGYAALTQQIHGLGKGHRADHHVRGVHGWQNAQVASATNGDGDNDGSTVNVTA